MKSCQNHSQANWAYFTKHLIKEACELTGLSKQEKYMFKNFDDFNFDKSANYEALSVDPGFLKKPFQPYAFICRHSYPKGLFQIFQDGAARYFLSITSQPIRVYREINENKLIELTYFDYIVRSCD
jgi:hypothetical protein